MDASVDKPHILVVDDDTRLRELLKSFLSRNGFRVSTASHAAEARQRLGALDFDLIVLDVMMPGETGLEFAAELRRTDDVPILMLTAMGETKHRIAGLEKGVDDYLGKPFEPRELLARLRAVLRRRSTPRGADILRFGRLEIDKGARLVRLDGEERAITSYQFALLLALAERAGRVLSRDALMDVLKGEKLEAFDRSVDVHVSRIRAAIEDDPKKPRRILTVRGAGYVFAREQDG